MNKILVAAVAAAIAAGASAPASAQPNVAYANNPINVVRYSVDPAHTISVPSGLGTHVGIEQAGKITISFVNAGSAPATVVEFAVRAGSTTERIVDKGAFAPGTSITHEFASAPQFGEASTIEVEQVTFADGTSWQRG